MKKIIKGCECFGSRAGQVKLREKVRLTGFAGKLKFNVIIGENMGTMGDGHFVQGLSATLGEDDGIRLLDGVKLCFAGVATGANEVFVSRDNRVEREDHLLLSKCLVKDEMAQDCAVIFCACKARLEEHSGLRDSSRNDAGAKKDKQDSSVLS